MNPGRTYAESALSQIPRLFSMLDRNPYSPSYGCFDRIYWLDKSIDFPSSILQLNADNLAIAYSVPFDENPYYGNEQVRDWAFAAMEYWTTLQHGDGSFDEFYPNERGWAGPTGFLLFSMLDAYVRLEDEMPAPLAQNVEDTAHDAAEYLATNDELGVLANHHAMALLPIYYTHAVFDRPDLLDMFYEKLAVLEGYQSPEGWLLEYDGADLGYLSATVSFLGKLYKLADVDIRTRILAIVEDAIDFSSQFAYPDHTYGGSVGSRQTLHFYPHGYRVFADKIPLAGKMADHMAGGVRDGKMAPPAVMPWRYVGYRVQEYLLTAEAYRDAAGEARTATGTTDSEPLPFERGPFRRFFDDAGMAVMNGDDYYLVANLARGGVVKLFDSDGSLLYNDCGVIGELTDGSVVTTQWVDEEYDFTETSDAVRVSGRLNYAPFTYPTPEKMMAFRLLLLTVGRSTTASYWLKGLIRKLFITNTDQSPVDFTRTVREDGDTIEVRDELDVSKTTFDRLSVGGEFAVRYVPQSRYFHPDELHIDSFDVTSQLDDAGDQVTISRRIDPLDGEVTLDYSSELDGDGELA